MRKPRQHWGPLIETRLTKQLQKIEVDSSCLMSSCVCASIRITIVCIRHGYQTKKMALIVDEADRKKWSR